MVEAEDTKKKVRTVDGDGPSQESAKNESGRSSQVPKVERQRNDELAGPARRARNWALDHVWTKRGENNIAKKRIKRGRGG